MKTRWCDWKMEGTVVPVFPIEWIGKSDHPKLKEPQCGGVTWCLIARPDLGQPYDRPICDNHVKNSQMYHAGYLRVDGRKVEHPDFLEYTKYGDHLEWSFRDQWSVP